MSSLSAFADEIGPDLEEQLRVLEECGLHYFDLRAMWRTGVLDLSDQQVAEIRKAIRDRGIGVAAIASPIGKSPIDKPASYEMDRLKRACELARALEAGTIRVFSFYPPEGAGSPGIASYRDEVFDRLRQWSAWVAAQAPGLVLVHENEARIYGEPAHRCVDLMENLSAPGFRACYDPANFVCADERAPFETCWKPLRDYVGYFHLKDCRHGGHVVPVGEGDGEVEQTLHDAAGRGFNGFLAVEPHLKSAGQFAGFSGPELFKKAVQAAKQVCEKAGLALS